jgi:hypothetical protein
MVSYLILSDSMVVNHDGNTTVINKEDGRYSKIVDKIKEGKLDEIIPLLDLTKELSERGFEVIHGLVHVDGEALPNALSTRLLQFYNEGLPFEPLLKFWKKLKQNPSFNSRQQLFAFLEHNGHPITVDGNFIAYRAVRNDFKDKHTGTMDNSIGRVVEMHRSLVDDNPNNTCSSGLHVATMSYVKGSFASGDDVILDVEVNPSDVVAVPTDYNGTKMRVCKFKVIAVSKGIRQETLATDIESEEDDIDDNSMECENCGAFHSIEEDECYWCGYNRFDN